MSLLQMLTQAQGGDGLGRLGQAFGIDPDTARSLAEKLAPAISSGVKARAAQEGGLQTVLSQLKGEDRAAYFDDPEAAAAPEAQAAGADFLAQIFGDRSAAPELAHAAAARTQAAPSQVEQFLPALAAMLQGGMQREAPDEAVDATMSGLSETGADRAGSGLEDLLGALQGGGGGALGGLLGALGGSGGGGGGGLGGLMNALGGGGGAQGRGGLGQVLQMLDADGDGSPLDDIVGRFLR